MTFNPNPENSLPEQDYLAILDTINRFNQCRTRDDLKKVFKNYIHPLLDAQTSLYCWYNPEFSQSNSLTPLAFPTII